MFPQLKYFHLGDNGLYYGNYGGLDYSLGIEDGIITGTSPPDPAPVDAYDALFYQHDLALQQASNPVEALQAHVRVAEGLYGLLSNAVSTPGLDWHLI